MHCNGRITQETTALSIANLSAWLLLIQEYYARRCLHSGDGRILCDRARLRLGVHTTMTPWELIMGSVMAVGLTAYLVYAMLRPEKF